MSESITPKEREFLKKLVLRQVDVIVMRALEVISRFAQYRIRELVEKGVVLSYSIGTNKERDKFVLSVTVEVPEWWLEEQIRRKAKFARMLRQMQYNIRRAEQYMYKWSEVGGEGRFDDILQEYLAEAGGEEEAEAAGEAGAQGGEAGGGEERREEERREERPAGPRPRVEIEIEGL